MATQRQTQVAELVLSGATITEAMEEAGYGPGCIAGLAPQMPSILHSIGLLEAGLGEAALEAAPPELPFSARVVGNLRTAGIESLSDLQDLSDNDLLALDGIGDSAIREIRAVVPAPDDAGEEEDNKE